MMLTFDLFDPEYGRSGKVTINPTFVESVVESERRWYGSHCEVAVIAMSSGAMHTVWDSSRRAAVQIAEAKAVHHESPHIDSALATLVTIGAKCIETRSWSTAYRGPLAIHMVICVTVLWDCKPVEQVRPSEIERAFGDYSPGRWAWELYGGTILANPAPVRGSLGLWEWHDPEAVQP